MQVKLLQVIDERTFTRVGGTTPVKVDVNIIAATNRDLDRMRSRGLFRDDLFYRLNVVPINIPPLRERREDIPVLALKVLDQLNRARGMRKQMSPEVLERLMQHDYPGNVRELINIVERMVVMSDGQVIRPDDLPEAMRGDLGLEAPPEGVGLKTAVELFEARMIRKALQSHNTLEQAAKSLGIHPTTLWRKLKRGEAAA